MSCGKDLLVRHSHLHPILTLCIPACASHMSHFAGCLVLRYLQKLFSFQLLESSHSLSITRPLQSNPTINTGYKSLNRITIKFGTKLKPTKHIVVNHNFTLVSLNQFRCSILPKLDPGPNYEEVMKMYSLETLEKVQTQVDV